MKVRRIHDGGVFVFTPEQHKDGRGTFMEAHRWDSIAAYIGNNKFIQSNISTSTPYVLRGLHYQVRRKGEKGQGKLLRCMAGRICQVSVDMREKSPTLGQWSSVILDGDLFEAVWVPPGFANGFYTFERGAVVHYEMTAYHEPELCRELSYRCPMVGIKWPMGPGSQIIASPKDKNAPFFDAVEKWK